ncbi:MAG: helix-turn-helix domain-containing protein [Pseudomonadota bacterium]
MVRQQRSARDALAHHSFAIGECWIEPALLRVVAADGTHTELSKRQIAALVELAEHFGQVVSRARMHEILCLAQEGHRDRAALSHHIGSIRRALGCSSKHPSYIRTVRGQGYCLMQPPLLEPIEGADAVASIITAVGVAASDVPGAATVPRPHGWRLSGWRGAPVMRAALTCVLALLAIGQALQGDRRELATRDTTDDRSASIFMEALRATAEEPDGGVSALARRRQEVWDDPSLAPHVKSRQLFAIGEALMCLRDWEGAGGAFEQSLSLQRASLPTPDPLTMAQALTGLARVTSMVGQGINDSRAMLIEAAQWLRNRRIDDRQRAEILSIHGGLMEFGNDLSRAAALYEQSLSLATSESARDEAFVLSLQTATARVATARGEYVRAEALLASLLASAQRLYGEGDRRLAPVLTQRALLLSKRGDHDAASRVYARIVSLLEQHYPDANSQLIHARVELAGSLESAGDSAAAAALYAEVIEHVRAKDASNVLGLSTLRLNLSDALISARQPEAAHAQVRQAMAVLEQRGDAPDWLRYRANSVYGAVLIELGECGEGLRRLNETIDEMFLQGVDDPRITAGIHARRARYANASCKGAVDQSA